MNNKVHLEIDGMGIVFFSAETMKDVIPDTDFLTSEFTSPQQIANHIKKGDIMPSRPFPVYPGFLKYVVRVHSS